MNAIQRFFQIRALLLASLVLTSFPCTAQSLGSGRIGTFTLTGETHWGKATLPAGEYTFKVESSSSFPLVIVRSVSGTTAAMVFPETQSMPDSTAHAGLVLDKKDGETYVKSLYVKEIGLVFQYGAPKKKPTLMAKKAEPAIYPTPAK
jgi:hypothetical protein